MEFDQEKTQGFDPSLVPDDVRKRRHAEIFGAGCDRGGVTEAARPMSTSEVLAKLFSYHRPTPDTLPKYAAINQAAKNFAEVILQNCPPSADRSDAIRKIREARMTANASIALDGLSL
jgi:hypothetical protein